MEILDGITQEPITIYGIGGSGVVGTSNVGSDGGKEGTEGAEVDGKALVPRKKEKEFFWWDLCAGPHLASTGLLDPKAIELLSVAGAYWRGDETKPMLQVKENRCVAISCNSLASHGAPLSLVYALHVTVLV